MKCTLIHASEHCELSLSETHVKRFNLTLSANELTGAHFETELLSLSPLQVCLLSIKMLEIAQENLTPEAKLNILGKLKELVGKL